MMPYDAIWCDMMRYDAIWCDMMRYDAICGLGWVWCDKKQTAEANAPGKPLAGWIDVTNLPTRSAPHLGSCVNCLDKKKSQVTKTIQNLQLFFAWKRSTGRPSPCAVVPYPMLNIWVPSEFHIPCLILLNTNDTMLLCSVSKCDS